MVELLVRLGLAALLLALSVVLKVPTFDLSWKIAAALAAASVFLFLLEKRGMRNGGISGIMAVIDAACIAVLLADAKQLDGFGFLTLAPLVWAVGKQGTNASTLAPLIAACVMLASNPFAGGFSTTVMLHTAGILLVGLLVHPQKTVVKERRVIITPEVPGEDPPPSDYEELRENFRSLRDHTRDLEQKTRRDRLAVLMLESATRPGDNSPATLSQTMVEAFGVRGAIVCSANLPGRLVTEGHSGNVPELSLTSAYQVVSGQSEAQMRSQIERRLLSLREPEERYQVGVQILKVKGKVVGCIALFADSSSLLEVAMEKVADVAESASALLARWREREEERRRLREAEILYSVACTSSGAESRASLAERIMRELGETFRLDHIGVSSLNGEEALQIASRGNPARLTDVLSFAHGPGVSGWLKTGAPETAIFDTFDDDRVPKIEAMRRRLGSFVMIPLRFGSEPTGFLSAGTQRVGGIDREKLETLRVVAAEVSQAFARLENPRRDSEGLMTPKEFQALIKQTGNGAMVYLEVLRRDEMTETYGKVAMEYAIRKFAARVRSMLPIGSGMCRRDEGDYVVFLRDVEDDFARRWANDVAASASLIGLATPDGREKIPLALRAKVAQIGQQKSEISRGAVA